MKKIINVFIISVLFASSGIAQNTTVKNIAMDKFTRQWIEIQFLQEQGLPKSLLPKVDSIYQSALAEKNYEQVLKAIIFQVNSMGILEDNDDAANKIFNTLKNDAEILPQPAKSVIYSMIAQMYEEYYNLNRWKVNERTYIQSDRSDVKTLDARSLAEETIRYYELSIQDENSLQNAPVGNYGAILQEGANDHKAQPTLFDLLINRALKYYDSEWNIHTLPQQAFVINDERYFSPAEEFVSIDIQPVDSLSPQYLSLKSYQRLLRFHLEKEDSPEALINNDLQRISYLKQKGRFADNEKLYENALIQMGKDYEKYDAGAQALLYLADYYYQQGDRWRYDRKNDYKSGFYKAYELAETIRKKSSGELAKTAESMIKALKNKELEVKFESVQLPNKPFLALMKFRNIGVLYQTVYKLTEEEALEYQFDYHKYGESYEFMISIFIDSLKTKPTVSAVSLPKHTDFQRYTTEIKIDPKEKGFYLILFSDGENALESDIFNAN
ncbi:MAG: hypothetical protein LBE91_06735, partial [Tannerella sp.]|nr:hypothetical protein [Tannerella sp.]